MEKHEIHLTDIYRILFGDATAVFLPEVVLRTLFIYLALLLTVRLMGKRMTGQLTISEMAVMLTLGAIVSPAMQTPSTGLLLGLMILVCTLSIQRGFNYLEFVNPRFEAFTHGRMAPLVMDGVLDLGELKRARLSRQQLFAVLRNEGIYQLGKVDRVYLEAYGLFSIYVSKETRAGLSMLPPADEKLRPAEDENKGLQACSRCGNVVSGASAPERCRNCNADSWIPATLN